LEFPSLSWLAASQVEALEGLVSLLRDTLADLEEQGEEIPATRLFVLCPGHSCGWRTRAVQR